MWNRFLITRCLLLFVLLWFIFQQYWLQLRCTQRGPICWCYLHCNKHQINLVKCGITLYCEVAIGIAAITIRLLTVPINAILIPTHLMRWCYLHCHKHQANLVKCTIAFYSPGGHYNYCCYYDSSSNSLYGSV